MGVEVPHREDDCVHEPMPHLREQRDSAAVARGHRRCERNDPFKNLTTHEAAVFKQTVAVPDVSKGDILDCDDVRAEGLLWKDREF